MDANNAQNHGAAAGNVAANAAQDGTDVAVETTTTKTVITKPGFFGKIARTLSNNPITTAVGVSLGTAGAVAGGINYRRYGTVLPPVVSNDDLAVVAAAFSDAWRS